MNVTRNLQAKCVRAKVMRRGKLYQDYFTVRNFRTWAKAEAAARRWTKALLARLPPPLPREGRLTKKNKSGIAGVYRSAGQLQRANGRKYSSPRWVARWPECPLRGGVSWSVRQFSEEGAFALAVICLDQKTADREQALTYLETIMDTPELDAICARRNV
jgi:hypothetical protein